MWLLFQVVGHPVASTHCLHQFWPALKRKNVVSENLPKCSVSLLSLVNSDCCQIKRIVSWSNKWICRGSLKNCLGKNQYWCRMMSSLHKCLIFVWNGEVQWCREGLPWLCQWDNWPGILKKCSIWGNPYSQAFEYILTRTSCTQASDTCFSAGRSSSWGCKSMCVLCTSADWSCSST